MVLFQLGRLGSSQGDATPNFFPDSKSLISGLSNDVSFLFLDLFWKVVNKTKCLTEDLGMPKIFSSVYAVWLRCVVCNVVNKRIQD